MTLSPDSTVGWGAAPVGGLGDEVSHKLPHNLKHFDYVSNKFSSCKTNTAYDLMDHSSESFKTFLFLFSHAAQNRGDSCLLCLKCSYI